MVTPSGCRTSCKIVSTFLGLAFATRGECGALLRGRQWPAVGAPLLRLSPSPASGCSAFQIRTTPVWRSVKLWTPATPGRPFHTFRSASDHETGAAGGERLRNSSRPDDIVLDPFAGSGFTLIACEGLGRRARLVELDPAYVDVIIQRWQALTGGSATLAQDARSFEEVAAERTDSVMPS
jgi:hypothetical protein